MSINIQSYAKAKRATMCLPHVEYYSVTLEKRNNLFREILIADTQGFKWEKEKRRIRNEFMAYINVTLTSPVLTIQVCMEKKRKGRGQTIKHKKERSRQGRSLLEALTEV